VAAAESGTGSLLGATIGRYTDAGQPLAADLLSCFGPGCWYWPTGTSCPSPGPRRAGTGAHILWGRLGQLHAQAGQGPARRHVELAPEGPQRGDLAEDIAAALAANPAAGAFFDTLAQFYRKGYLRYIDATTRRPDLRAARIAEVVGLLADGIKERPRP
jgi:hypothetical protein